VVTDVLPEVEELPEAVVSPPVVVDAVADVVVDAAPSFATGAELSTASLPPQAISESVSNAANAMVRILRIKIPLFFL
jgi:hypothetical protein